MSITAYTSYDHVRHTSEGKTYQQLACSFLFVELHMLTSSLNIAMMIIVTIKDVSVEIEKCGMLKTFLHVKM
jgi:hypothetical protein